MNWSPDPSKRCPRCVMRIDLCLCKEFPNLETKTRLVLLMHFKELSSFSNTGRLGVLSLRNSIHLLRGSPQKPYTSEDLCPDGYEGMVLYPSEDAEVLTPDFVKSLKKPASLVVPDGNWRQAAKMPIRDPLLKNFRRVKLELLKPSQYLLRHEPKSFGLATLEAIARAFGVLENSQVQESLELVFMKMNYRCQWARGKISKEEAAPYLPV
jgi:DTW domain-containing protein YfiP